jgi:hypothetical protein
MTLTATQVQDIQTTIVNDLEAGTFTLYGSTPQIHKEAQKKSSKNTWIEVLATKGDIIQAMNGAIIYFSNRLELQVHSPNREDVDKIYADVLNILVDSSHSYTFSGSWDRPRRSRYARGFIIKLVDI